MGLGYSAVDGVTYFVVICLCRIGVNVRGKAIRFTTTATQLTIWNEWREVPNLESNPESYIPHAILIWKDEHKYFYVSTRLHKRFVGIEN